MPTKDDTIRTLARIHFDVEPEMEKIYVLRGRAETEAQAAEPVNLLEVNRATIPAGIMPLRFRAYPDQGIHHPSVIVEITPDEFEQIVRNELALPDGWRVCEEIPDARSEPVPA